ncbi:MarR family winged helix-turn-helix transcriptional regulator [Halocynthiibacter styelae]|uniref:MarR family transcriptional regulator n=1 Tax=Halocynthiibacter styelae TaxID=2761955 RepID=A0A8J7J3X1_9RHOB|nr:MarR family transcriptional regulator [Paenihalocynthiibacter styelae]MBI1492825.1 MarR family transcriptional regulator [Paenihalocynthiibacter styelae]
MEKASISEIQAKLQENWPEALTPACRVVLGAYRLSEIVEAKTNPVLAAHGLTDAGFETLVALRAEKGRQMTPSELWRAVLITSGGMTKLLKQFEEVGYVIRADNPEDKRSRFVQLTEKGAAHIEATMAAVADNDRDIFEGVMSDAQLNDLADALQLALSRMEGGETDSLKESGPVSFKETGSADRV